MQPIDAITRIKNDYKDVLLDPPANCSAGPTNPDDIYKWEGTILGPEESPYAGGVFFLKIEFPKNYPNKPPMVVFTTPVYHPNIGSNGSICVDILKEHTWNPKYSIAKVLIAINCLLVNPNPDSCLNSVAGQLYKSNRSQYDKTVREWVAKHARAF